MLDSGVLRIEGELKRSRLALGQEISSPALSV